MRSARKHSNGLDALTPYLVPGHTLVVLGSSGVGKSTLINRLVGNERLATQEVRDSDHRGKHTTTHRELIVLPGGALLIDTPGMRELQLWSADAGVAETFDDIVAIASGCFFANCQHDREPRCAVKQAVAGWPPAGRTPGQPSQAARRAGGAHGTSGRHGPAGQEEAGQDWRPRHSHRHKDERSYVSQTQPPRARPTRVKLLVTCLIDTVYPQVGFSTVALLERLGVTVDVPPNQTCCGQPAFNSGSWDDARAMARHLIDVFGDDDVPVVVPSGSCGDMVIHQAPHLLKDDAQYGPRAARARRPHPRADAVRRRRAGRHRRRRAHSGDRLTYHPACHGLRGLGVARQPLALLEKIDGPPRCPLPDAETCCGFGGLFAVKLSEVSGSLLDRKIANIEASGADTLVATDVSCLMHIAGGLHRKGSAVKVKHLAEVLAEGLSR